MMQTIPEIERSFLVFSSRYLIGSELCFRKRHRRCLCRMVCWLEMQIKEMAWYCGNECKGADCRNCKCRIKVRQCLVHRQEEKGNSENGFATYDGRNRRKSSNFFRREDDSIWFLDILVDGLTEHLEILVYYLFRNGYLELMREVRNGSKGFGLLCGKIMVKLRLCPISPRLDNLRRGGTQTEPPGVWGISTEYCVPSAWFLIPLGEDALWEQLSSFLDDNTDC